MSRESYFGYIEANITYLAFRIKTLGKINLLSLNIHSETFFADLFNLVFGFNLKNLNSEIQNVEGIDLIDNENNLVMQVSSTSTKQKIESSLEKEIFRKIPGFRFKFIAIAEDASNLKKQTYKNPNQVQFSPDHDIYDIQTILRKITSLSINELKVLYDFIKQELGNEVDIVKFDSNLAAIINIISKEDLNAPASIPEINCFDIDRKIEFNDLVDTRSMIDDYKIYYGKVDEKYKEYDRYGANKSLSVLSVIRQHYIMLSNEKISSHEMFFEIINRLVCLITNSKNYNEIPIEELMLCVSILVVDAFIRCKIYRNPEGYNHVTTR